MRDKKILFLSVCVAVLSWQNLNAGDGQSQGMTLSQLRALMQQRGQVQQRNQAEQGDALRDPVPLTSVHVPLPMPDVSPAPQVRRGSALSGLLNASSTVPAPSSVRAPTPSEGPVSRPKKSSALSGLLNASSTTPAPSSVRAPTPSEVSVSRPKKGSALSGLLNASSTTKKQLPKKTRELVVDAPRQALRDWYERSEILQDSDLLAIASADSQNEFRTIHNWRTIVARVPKPENMERFAYILNNLDTFIRSLSARTSSDIDDIGRNQLISIISQEGTTGETKERLFEIILDLGFLAADSSDSEFLNIFEELCQRSLGRTEYQNLDLSTVLSRLREAVIHWKIRKDLDRSTLVDDIFVPKRIQNTVIRTLHQFGKPSPGVIDALKNPTNFLSEIKSAAGYDDIGGVNSLPYSSWSDGRQSYFKSMIQVLSDVLLNPSNISTTYASTEDYNQTTETWLNAVLSVVENYFWSKSKRMDKRFIMEAMSADAGPCNPGKLRQSMVWRDHAEKELAFQGITNFSDLTLIDNSIDRILTDILDGGTYGNQVEFPSAAPRLIRYLTHLIIRNWIEAVDDQDNSEPFYGSILPPSLRTPFDDVMYGVYPPYNHGTGEILLARLRSGRFISDDVLVSAAYKQALKNVLMEFARKQKDKFQSEMHTALKNAMLGGGYVQTPQAILTTSLRSFTNYSPNYLEQQDPLSDSGFNVKLRSDFFHTYHNILSQEMRYGYMQDTPMSQGNFLLRMKCNNVRNPGTTSETGGIEVPKYEFNVDETQTLALNQQILQYFDYNYFDKPGVMSGFIEEVRETLRQNRVPSVLVRR